MLSLSIFLLLGGSSPLQAAITHIPHTEDFEHGGDIPTDWTFNDNFTIKSTATGNHTTDGIYSAGITAGSGDNTMISEAVNYDGLTAIDLSFWLRGTSAAAGWLKVDADLNDANTWNIPVVAQFTLPTDSEFHEVCRSSEDYGAYYQDLTSLAGQSNVKFKWTLHRTGGTINIDDIYFDADGLDTIPPEIVSAIANDASGLGAGIQALDQVVITFSESMNPAVINAAAGTIGGTNIDIVLNLGGNTWKDSTTPFFGASTAWSADDTVLTITLSTDPNTPSVVAGDTITPDGATLEDPYTNALPASATKQITGSFGCGAVSGDLVINEVAFDETGSKDWIEIKVITAGNYDTCRIYKAESLTLISTIPNWGDLAKDDYIVIHMNQTGTDDVAKSDNNTGYWDIYSPVAGLVGTDNVIEIKMPEGDDTLIDVVIYSNDNGSFTGDQSEANAAVTGPPAEWDGSANYDTTDADAWTNSDKVGDGQSIGRDCDSTDTNSKSDWHSFASSSMGEENPAGLASGVSIKINEVSFNADGGRDWVELYCEDDGTIDGSGVDIGGCYFEDDTSIKTIHPGTIIKTGKYLVLNPAAGMAVTFIDVGQGDSCLVQTPKPKRILIDGGGVSAGLTETKPYLDQEGVNTLHRVVATHADEDHIGGLTRIVDTKIVEEIWDTYDYPQPWDDVTTIYKNFRDMVSDEEDCTYVTPTIGTYTWDEDYNVTATVLNNYATRPTGATEDDRNACSIVIHLKYGIVSFMLTGDAESSTQTGYVKDGVEERLVSAHGLGLASDILKVGHHGSDGATSDDFLTYVNPDIAIISVGSNTHDHPTSAAMGRLHSHGIPYYATGTGTREVGEPDVFKVPTGIGNITFFTNGMSYWQDETSAGSDEIINIFAHSTGLTATGEQVIFKDALGDIKDAVCWANDSNDDGALDLPDTELIDLTVIYDAGEWSGKSASDCIDSDLVSANHSIARKNDGEDTDYASDWKVCSDPTRGKSNSADMPSGVGISGLGVTEDPFLSDGSDLNRRYTSIFFSLNMAAEVTAQVLDGRGGVVRTLGEDKYYIADSHSFKWDGKNGSGDSVPIGYYTIYVKAIAEDGTSDEATITVTVAKSLSGGGSGGCFIATAAYSEGIGESGKGGIGENPRVPVSPCHPVNVLRDFRDQYLLTNPLGRAFVSTYNRISPPIAEFISDKEPLKAVVRAGLKPVVWTVKRILE